MRKIISANIANITKGELFPFNVVHHLLQILEEYVHFQGMCTDILSNYDSHIWLQQTKCTNM